MLEIITKGFSTAKSLLKKEATLSEENISGALKEVRLSLLEADVEYSVVTNFINHVKTQALGVDVKTAIKDKSGRTHKLGPAEHFIRICYEELERLMGPEVSKLELKSSMASFMLVGLQGSGKTTSCAKLARYLKDDLKKKPMLVAADIYRPGAAHQLEILGKRLDIPVFHQENTSAEDICTLGLIEAKRLSCNAIIYDTAGRLAIDSKLMDELSRIKSLVKPEEIYLVVDAMIGQDAVRTATEFNNKLDVSGFIMTKLDGDARGGAAISIKEVTKKPIKFIGMGEDLNSLELFRPQGLAGRILGMGDVVSLAKDFEKHVDEKEAEADVKKLLKGSFSFDDFIKQLNMIKKLGSFQSVLERIPGMQDMLPSGTKIDDREFTRFESMILSMTKQERSYPELLVKQKSRRERIALGSGRKIGELDTLIERFMTMRQMMGTLGKNPQALGSLPMFRDLAPQVPNIKARPVVSNKHKKDKRKSQKQARKKNKKR